jgi:peptide/nickel transport system substrate-binding protein
MIRKAAAVAAAAVAVALLLATGCSAGGASSSSSADSVTVGIADQPANLDFTTTDGAAIPWVLLDNVYEGLVTLNDDGEIEPLLAESWTVSDDGLTYDFALQPDVTFSNGSPFDAEAVKFSIERVKDGWTSSLKTYMDVVSTVEVVSADEVKVTLSKPSNEWLFRMTTRIGAMFSPDGVDSLSTETVGTGPYELGAFTPGDSLELTARDDYWGDAVAIPDVTFQFFTDSNAQNSALLSGTIDAIDTLQSIDTISQFESSEAFTVNTGTTNSEVTLSMNNASGIFSDIRVRQAVQYGIDREALIQNAVAGKGTLIGSMVPPTDPWYEDLSEAYPYDVEKATALVAEAGVAGSTVRFRIPSLPSVQAAAQIVQSDLAEIGLNVEIETLDFPAVWLEQVFTNKDYDMSIINHVEARDLATYANPDYYWGYDDAEYQALFAAADLAPTAEEQNALLAQAAKMLSDDAVSDWLYLESHISITKSNLVGYPKNQLGESINLTHLAWE